MTVPKHDAYVRICDMIFEQRIPPGTHLVERQIAEKLGISRVPVREALQRLVLEGVLIYVPGKGLVTRTYDEQELLDLYHYREPLDGMAARLFCQRADDAEMQFLSQILGGMSQQVERGNLEALHRNDFEFHLAVARGARNSRLFGELQSLYQECLYVTRTAFSPMVREIAQEEHDAMRGELLVEHQRIYEAIEQRDGEAAERAARSSVRNGLKRFIRQFAEERIKSLD